MPVSHMTAYQLLDVKTTKMASPNYCTKKYEYKFITEPDESFICRTCLEVARDPWQHGKCGMLFCEECLEKYGRVKACPHCRRDQPQYFEDNKSQREIKAFRVRCDNVGRGCKWEGTVGTLDDHVTKVCQFTPTPCPNKCKDGSETKRIMIKDLEKHLNDECVNREHICTYCGKKDTFASITGKHDQICERKILPCPNKKCKKTMERRKIKEHTKECDYSVVSCKYKIIGCDTEMERKDMRDHEENNQLHLQQSLHTVVEMKKKIKIISDDLVKTLCVVNRLESGMTKTIPINLKNKESMFPAVALGKCVIILFYTKEDDNIAIGARFEPLDPTLETTISIEILNRLKDENHYKITLTPKDKGDDDDDDHDNDDDDGLDDQIAIPLAKLTALENVNYFEDDTILLRVSVKRVNPQRPWLVIDGCPLTYEEDDLH